jgi:hypothetical protein
MTAIILETLKLLGIKINKNQFLKLKNIIIIKNYFKIPYEDVTPACVVSV